jgi:hypothetical protein
VRITNVNYQDSVISVSQFNVAKEYFWTRNSFTEHLISVGAVQNTYKLTHTHTHTHTLALHVSNRIFRQLTNKNRKNISIRRYNIQQEYFNANI